MAGQWGNRAFPNKASAVVTNTTRSVPYAALAKVFSLIEATTKRLEKTSLLTSFLLLVIQRSGKGDTQSLLQSVYLCINRVRLLSISVRRLRSKYGLALSRLCWNRAWYRREPVAEGHRRVHR